MEQQTGFKELFLRLVAIVGLVAVLILGAWGIILLAFNLVGLFNGSVHLSNLFNHNDTVSTTATTTVPVFVATPANNTGSPAQTTTKPASNQPTAVYTAAPTRATNLYGLPDLKATITSINSLSSVQGRTVVQFTIINGGTNVARSGWSFSVTLPYQGSTYTYQAQSQQALYPGDSIAYTLSYDDPSYSYNNNYNYNNQYCATTYPYTCYTNYNQYNTPYQYTNTGTCYSYNGYQNIAYPCNNYSYNYNNYYNNQYQNYNYNYNNYGYRTVTVTVDPQNWVVESDEYNNSTSKSF